MRFLAFLTLTTVCSFMLSCGEKKEEGLSDEPVTGPEPKVVPANEPVVVEPKIKPAGAPEPFTVEAQFVVPTPPNGFKWTYAREVDQEGVKTRIYICMKEGQGATVLTLNVQERKAENDEMRRAAVKGHYNAIVASAKSGGLTNLVGQQPSLESPISDKVFYSLRGTRPDGGGEIYSHVITRFGRFIYGMQAWAETEKELEVLAACLHGLEELPEKKE